MLLLIQNSGYVMKFVKFAVLALAVLITSGCAGGLNSIQEREYKAFENEGVLIEEKSPMVGAVLGILPGFGSFYAREPGYGIVNLLFWPISVLWDPVSGYSGSKSINYDTTKSYLRKEKNKELVALEDLLVSKQIDSTKYLLEKRKIEQKYEY